MNRMIHVSFVYVASNEPAERAAGNHVGREMPLSAQARETDERCESAGSDGVKHIAVPLVRDHRGQSPAFGGVPRGKRRAAYKEPALSIPVERPLTPGGRFENFRDDQAIKNGFAA